MNLIVDVTAVPTWQESLANSYSISIEEALELPDQSSSFEGEQKYYQIQFSTMASYFTLDQDSRKIYLSEAATYEINGPWDFTAFLSFGQQDDCISFPEICSTPVIFKI